MKDIYEPLDFTKRFLAEFKKDPGSIFKYFSSEFMEDFANNFESEYDKRRFLPQSSNSALTAYNILLYHYPAVREHVLKLAKPFRQKNDAEKDLLILFEKIRDAGKRISGSNVKMPALETITSQVYASL